MRKSNNIDVSKIKWVFIDFFDTIIHRNCSSNDVKKKWAVEMERKFNLNMTCEEIYKIRVESEIQLEQTSGSYGEFTYLELCEEVFFRIRSALSGDVQYDFEQFMEEALYIEQRIECAVQYVDKKILEILEHLYQQNIKIAIVSDFYMTKKELEFFLREKKIEKYFDEIFVSCEKKCNKRKGKLFEVVCKELEVNYNECIMIGDNKRSDYLIPQKMGIKAFYRKAKYSSEYLTYDSIVRQINEIVKERKEIPYSNYAFLLFLFVERLHYRLQKEGFKEVYFLAREGEFLKRIFELYQDNFVESHKVVSKYLYVSRVATYVPTLKDLENERFNTIFRDYPSINVKAFLGSIGFDEDEIEQILKGTNLSERKASDFVNVLKTIPEFKEKYDEKRRQQKKLLKQYLYQEGINKEKKKIAVVDVGWRGTIQDNLFKAMDLEMEIYGYYIGITGKSCYEAKSHKEGLIFSKYPYCSEHYDTWSFDKTFLERLLYASHPSTNSYEEKEKCVVPVMNQFQSEQGIYDKVVEIQEEIIRKVFKIGNVLSDKYWTADKLSILFANIHLNTILLIDSDKMRLQRELLNAHYENFGYITSYGENSKKVFTVKNILNKIKENYRRLKSVELVSRVLLSKKCYWGICILYFMKYRSMRATLKK